MDLRRESLRLTVLPCLNKRLCVEIRIIRFISGWFPFGFHFSNLKREPSLPKAHNMLPVLVGAGETTGIRCRIRKWTDYLENPRTRLQKNPLGSSPRLQWLPLLVTESACNGTGQRHSVDLAMDEATRNTRPVTLGSPSGFLGFLV